MKPSFNFLLGLSLTTITSIPLHGQSSITGSVADNKGTSLVFATVLLLDAKDSALMKGNVTQEDGSYQLDNVTTGLYIIGVSLVGYTAAFSDLIHVGAGKEKISVSTLVLSEATTQLSEITVTGRKNLYDQRIDRLVINVQSSPTMAGNTALEILEKSPGVIVDRQNSALNINGKTGVQVLVDGKLMRIPMSGLFGLLSGMTASNIEKIELITTPPASYDAEGDGGFINIELKKNDSEGVNGTFSGTIGSGRQERLVAAGNINWRNKKFNLFADYNFNHNDGLHFAHVDRTIENTDYTFGTISTTRRDNNTDMSNARLGFDFYLSSKTIIGVLGTFYDRMWTQKSETYAIYDVDPGADTINTGTRVDTNPSRQYTANINLEHNFKGTQRVNVDLDYLMHNIHQPQTYKNTYRLLGGQMFRTEDMRVAKETPVYIWVGAVDYKVNVRSNLTLESGLKGTFSHLKNDVLVQDLENDQWKANMLFTERGSMNEDIYGAYGSMTYNSNGKTAIQAGLRYEYSRTEIESDSEGIPVLRHYGLFFPTLFLSRKIGPHQSVALAYNRRISRPTFADLAPWVIFLDPNTYFTGNPSLLPVVTNAVKADFTVKSLIISLQYTLEKNTIAKFQPTLLTGSDVMAYSSRNLDKTEICNATLTFPLNVTQWWQIQNNVTGLISRVKTMYAGGLIDISQISYNMTTSHIFTAPKDLNFELTALYYSSMLFGVFTTAPRVVVNIGIQKKFGAKGGSLALNVSNVFRPFDMNWIAHFSDLNIQEAFRYDFDTRAVTVTYTKSFGNSKLISRNKRKTGAEETKKRVGE